MNLYFFSFFEMIVLLALLSLNFAYSNVVRVEDTYVVATELGEFFFKEIRTFTELKTPRILK